MKIDPKRIVSTDSPGMTRVRRVLAEATEPLDGRTIAERACISFLTFQNTYRHLLQQADLIHVSGWAHNPVRGPFVPLFSAGQGVTPPKPKKYPPTLNSRRWKARTGYHEFEKAARRLARPRDPIIKALTKETSAP